MQVLNYLEILLLILLQIVLKILTLHKKRSTYGSDRQ